MPQAKYVSAPERSFGPAANNPFAVHYEVVAPWAEKVKAKYDGAPTSENYLHEAKSNAKVWELLPQDAAGALHTQQLNTIQRLVRCYVVKDVDAQGNTIVTAPVVNLRVTLTGSDEPFRVYADPTVYHAQVEEEYLRNFTISFKNRRDRILTDCNDSFPAVIARFQAVLDAIADLPDVD